MYQQHLCQLEHDTVSQEYEHRSILRESHEFPLHVGRNEPKFLLNQCFVQNNHRTNLMAKQSMDI